MEIVSYRSASISYLVIFQELGPTTMILPMAFEIFWEFLEEKLVLYEAQIY